ncbi:MAG: hypothetical protein ACQEV6_06500 [Pseudomonadota bacterium]
MGEGRFKQGMIGHIAIALAWLSFLAIVNRHGPQSVELIFPYLAPVVFFSWVYGITWGILLAVVATLAALPGEYLDTHTTVDLFYAGFSTYAQLTGAAIGVGLARALSSRAGRS